MGRQCSQLRRLAALTILPQVCQQDCPSIRQSAVTRTRHIHSRSRHARCTSRALHIAHAHHALHIAQHATTSALAQHTHTHMPHSRLGDRGELSQNSCDRASHERRQGGRRLFIRPRLLVLLSTLTTSRNASARHQHQSACLKHIHDARAYLRASQSAGVVCVQVFLNEMLQCSETQAGWHGKAFRRKLRAVVCGRPCRIT
jgi:hypothetical protein